MEQPTRLFSRSMGRWLMALLLVMVTSLAAKAAEAYACYTPSNTTLTFYYDDQRSTRPGTTYDLNTAGHYPGWHEDYSYYDVTRVVFHYSFANARPTSTCAWFGWMETLTSITGLNYLNTSQVTDMSDMFANCWSLTSLGLGGFNTANVTDMTGMFSGCSGLTSLNVSSFNTANVTAMNSMFYGCSGLTSLNVSSFNTAKVTNMQGMFNGCSGLTSLNLSNFNTANVISFNDMFAGCSGLTSLDLGNFNTAKVQKMMNMFLGCTELKIIKVSSGWTTNAVTTSTTMFYHCNKLVGGQGTTYDANHVDKAYAHIDGGTSNPGYLTDSSVPEAYACYTPGNKTLTFYYDTQRCFRPGTSYLLNTGGGAPEWLNEEIRYDVTKVVFDSSFADARPTSTNSWFREMNYLTSITGMYEYLNTSEVTDMGYMFSGCSRLTSLNLSGFNTANVTNMQGMFQNCRGLTSLNLMSGSFVTDNVTNMSAMFQFCTGLTDLRLGVFNTANVTNMSNMFDYCSGLTSLNLGYEFKTANVTNMSGMFGRCEKLTSLDVSGFNTANVTNMSGMFTGCLRLRSLDVSSFNTANVTSMYSMFAYCSGLTSLDVSKFNTAKVENMSCMFENCSGLTSLNLGNFNTARVRDMDVMFEECTNLETIYAGDGWTTNAITEVSNSMFYNCTKLVGGQGTTYDANHTDKAYAHIDGGTSNPGYFTEWKEGYACYTPSNTTLTFYYDGHRCLRTGTTYDLNTDSNSPRWHRDGTDANVTKVVFDLSFANARPTATCQWFAEMTNLTSITGLNYLNTSEVTNMSSMFTGCSGLTSLDVSGFNTANVLYMGGMFYGCKNLTSLNVSNFNTANVTNMSDMFYNCSGVTSLDVSNWNTANVTSMYWMFWGCSSLRSLDLSNFNTAKVEDMRFMFVDCSNLKTIYAGSGWTISALISGWGYNMFSGCTSLVGGQGTTYDPGHRSEEYARIDGGPSHPGYFTDINGPRPYACYTTANNGTLTFYYDTQRRYRAGTTYDLNTGDNVPGWSDLHEDIHHVIFDPSFADARPTSTYFWFYGFEEPEFIGWNYLNTSEVTNMSCMFGFLQYLESIDVSHFDTSKVTDMSEMFEYTALTSLDLSSFNTSNVTDMRLMFCESPSLQTIYVGPGWTTAAVTSSAEMFSNCTSLVGGHGTSYSASNPKDKTYAHLDGGPSNPGYFTDPYAGAEAYACYTPSNTTLTFYYDTDRSIRTGTTYDLNTGSNTPGWRTDSTCRSVTKVVFDPSFAAARPTSTYRWFSLMNNLTSIIGISYLKTENVKDMQSMFYYCSSLTNLDLSSFNTANVTNMSSMFSQCSSLASLDLSNFSTAKAVSMSYMFNGCSGLTSLNLSGFNTANVTNMAWLFGDCSGLTSLDLSNFNTSKVINMTNMFRNNAGLVTIYVGSEWSTDAVTTSTNMFTNCTNLVGGMGTTYEDYYPVDKTFAHIDGGPYNPGYFTDINNTPEAYACYTPLNSRLTFYYDSHRSVREGTTYDLNEGNEEPVWIQEDAIGWSADYVFFDPSFADARPTSTYKWFDNFYNSDEISDINYLNTSEVTNMAYMFHGCWGLASVDLSNFNTAKVTDMKAMFMECSHLTSLDLSSFNTENVTNMASMFDASYKIESLDVSSFNTAKVTNMNGMFLDCNSLLNLDVSNFNTAKVTDMSWMFSGCTELTSLDLSNFNTTKVTDMNNMFSHDGEMITIYVDEGWTTAAVTNSAEMFYYCTELVGGKGTTYDANHIDKAYAHIGGGTSNPGYFTNINATAEPEAYAVYTAGNTTLTFYFDGQRSTREGTTYDLNVGMANPGWDDDNSYKSVTHVVFDPSFADARPVSTCSWFWGMTNLQSITGMDCMNTEDVTTMWGMFTTCSSLTTIDLSSFNTSKVTNMLGMFSGCSNLTTIYAGSGWSTATVSVGVNMFTNCTKLVGGQGTTYNANHVDKSYARIDGGPSNPGYFTEKNAYLRGDVNGDGQVKISDVTALINYLLSGEASGINLQAADCNLDGQVKIGDVTALINYLLSGTW